LAPTRSLSWNLFRLGWAGICRGAIRTEKWTALFLACGLRPRIRGLPMAFTGPRDQRSPCPPAGRSTVRHFQAGKARDRALRGRLATRAVLVCVILVHQFAVIPWLFDRGEGHTKRSFRGVRSVGAATGSRGGQQGDGVSLHRGELGGCRSSGVGGGARATPFLAGRKTFGSMGRFRAPISRRQDLPATTRTIVHR